MKSAGSIKSFMFWSLAGINAVLLVGVLAPYVHDNTAMAARARRPSLMLIPGQVIGENSSVVYLIDTANQRIGAVALSNTGKALSGMAPVSLSRVFEDAPAGGGGNAPETPARRGAPR